MKKSTYCFEFFVYVFLFLVFLFSVISLLVIESNKKNEFEKETWLNIEQLSEKYHVTKDQILEKYNEIKYSQQSLEGEISNALNKTK